MVDTLSRTTENPDLERILAVLRDDELKLPGSLRDEILSIVENGMLSRLDDADRPLNVVFAGPTGSGKSTLINSVAGRVVSTAGVLRPTTTTPLVYGKANSDIVLTTRGLAYDHVVGHAPILDSISLIDTPDLDSTNLDNRRKALAALERSDLVVFVTSALRYADLVPWEIFRSIWDRGVPILFVLNRVSSETAGVVTDFRRRARSEGMSLRIVRIEEHHLKTGDLLPAASVRDLRRAILTACSNPGIRDTTLKAGVDHFLSRLFEIRKELVSAGKSRQELSHLATGLALQPSVGFQAESDRWDAEWAAVNRWMGKRTWRPRYEGILGKIKTEIIGIVETALRIGGVVGGQKIVDLGDATEPDVLQLLDDLVDAWVRNIGNTSLTEMGYKAAREKVRVAIDSTRSVFAMDDEGPREESVLTAAASLDSEIKSLLDAASRQLAGSNLTTELALIDGLIEMLEARNSRPIAANA